MVLRVCCATSTPRESWHNRENIQCMSFQHTEKGTDCENEAAAISGRGRALHLFWNFTCSQQFNFSFHKRIQKSVKSWAGKPFGLPFRSVKYLPLLPLPLLSSSSLPRAFEVWTSSNPSMWKILVCPAFYPSNPSVFVSRWHPPHLLSLSLLVEREKKKKKRCFFPHWRWGGVAGWCLKHSIHQIHIACK